METNRINRRPTLPPRFKNARVHSRQPRLNLFLIFIIISSAVLLHADRARAVSKEVEQICKDRCQFDLSDKCFMDCLREIAPFEMQDVEVEKIKSRFALIASDPARGSAITIDDVYFFPVGIMGVQPWDMEEIAAAGFNLVHTDTTCCGKPEPEMQENFLETAAYYHLWAAVSPFFPQEQILDASESQIRELSNNLMRRADIPSLLFWMDFEMPDVENTLTDLCKRVDGFVNEVDPNHPTANILSLPDKYMDYAPASDWLITAPFPLPYFPIEMVRDRVGAAVSAAAGAKPVLAAIQVTYDTGWFAEDNGEAYPSEEEMYNMAHQAAAAGANGLLFWTMNRGDFDLTRFPGQWAAVKRIATALNDRSFVFSLQNATQTVTVYPTGAHVDLMAKVDDTYYYLLVVNYKKTHIDIRLDLSRLDVGKVEILPNYMRPDLYVTQPGTEEDEFYGFIESEFNKDKNKRNRLRKYMFENNILEFEMLPIDVWWIRIEKPHPERTY